MMKKIHYAVMSASLFYAAAMPSYAGQSASDAVMDELSPYIHAKDIALTPTLLRNKDVEDFDFSKIQLPSSATQHQDAVPQQPSSELESLYNERCNCTLHQFGYNLLWGGNPTSRGEATAAIQDSYILERGDEISILLRGQTNGRTTTTVNDEGQLIIDTMPPIAAAGRSLKEVRSEIQAYSKELYNTDIYVSLAKTSDITITVAGDVTLPGQYDLTSFASLLDALKMAGGVSKTGTLRQIKLIRDGKSARVDLYGVLVYGSGASNLSLRHGDRIVVGPLGPTIAVAGESKRPGIYEILPAEQSLWTPRGERSQKLSLSDLMDLSGGPLSPAQHRFIKLSIDDESGATPISDMESKLFEDGDVLVMSSSRSSGERIDGAIEIKGETPATGLYTLAENPKLSHILSNDKAITAQTYPLLGVIERWDDKRLAHELIAFSPLHVINGDNNVTLHESDTITLFARKDILGAAPELEETEGDIVSPEEQAEKNQNTPIKKSAKLSRVYTHR